jgi:AcrR family transcriptional regulator
MSPQPSNRERLIEGALRCVDRLPPHRITARAIAAESGANLASIGYHFGSKDELVTAAVIEGLDRWLAEIEARLSELETEERRHRFVRAAKLAAEVQGRRAGLARGLLAALARAQHDDAVRARLAEGYRRTRPALARVLGLGEDVAAEDAAGLALAMFNGVIFQGLLDPVLAIKGKRMERAQARLREALPE